MKKVLSILILIFSLTFQTAFAENTFSNDIKAITFNKNSVGKPEIILTLDKNENLRVIKKDELEYVILMPETSNSLKDKPSLNIVSDIITDIDVKTQPYVGNIKGYTKITVKTVKPVTIVAKSTLETPNIIVPEVNEKLAKKEQKPNIIEKIIKKTNPKLEVKKEIKNEKVKNKKTSLKEEKQDNKPVEKAVEEPVKQEDTQVSEQSENKVAEEINKENENNEVKVDTPVSEPPKTAKKAKSFHKSLIITGILLILLLLLKRFNKLRQKNIQTVESSEANTEQNPQEFIPPAEFNMPVHESSYHEQIHEINHEIPDEPVEESIQEYNQEVYEDVSSNEQVIPNVSQEITEEHAFENNMNNDFSLENEFEKDISDQQTTEQPETLNDFHDKEELTKQDFQEPEPLTVEDLETFDDSFGQDVSPDDVFGVFEDEVDETPVIDNETEEIVETPVINVQNEISAEPIISENFEEDSSGEIDNSAEEMIYISPQSQDITNNMSEDITDDTEHVADETVEQTEEQADEQSDETIEQTDEQADDTEENDDEVIKGSYALTPTKSLYLVDYDGTTLLMSAVKDEYTVLKKFDEIIDKPLIVRQTEKNSKKTTYIVRVGQFRGVVEVTMKNVELVLEL